jgi:hypothetical protein
MRKKAHRKHPVLGLVFLAAFLGVGILFIVSKETDSLFSRRENVSSTRMGYPDSLRVEESEIAPGLLVPVLVAGKRSDKETIRSINAKLSATALSGMCDGENPDYYYTWKATTTLLTPYLWSLDTEYSEFCGGVHPNQGWSGLTYLLEPYGSVTWTYRGEYRNTTIGLKDLFIDYQKNKKKIFSIVKEKYGEHIPECRDSEEVEFILEDAMAPDAVDPFLFSVSEDGMIVRAFMLPRPLLYCEPYDLFIPYADFQPYMNNDFLTMVRHE